MNRKAPPPKARPVPVQPQMPMRRPMPVARPLPVVRPTPAAVMSQRPTLGGVNMPAKPGPGMAPTPPMSEPFAPPARPGPGMAPPIADAGGGFAPPMMAKGGKVGSASRRADGIAQRGKTRGRVI